MFITIHRVFGPNSPSSETSLACLERCQVRKLALSRIFDLAMFCLETLYHLRQLSCHDGFQVWSLYFL